MISRPVILGILGIMFVVSLYYKAKIMNSMQQIKKHQLIFTFNDLMKKDKFHHLITNTYPDHAELLTTYRGHMRQSIVIMGVLLSILALYIISTFI